ncbi:MAG: hypothetical protein AAF346_12460 [Pseudomonadota bacterium]
MEQRTLTLAEILEKQSIILSREGMTIEATAATIEANQLRLLALLG